MVNDTVKGALPVVVEGVNAATGRGSIPIMVAEAVFDPPALVTVRVTV